MWFFVIVNMVNILIIFIGSLYCRIVSFMKFILAYRFLINTTRVKKFETFFYKCAFFNTTMKQCKLLNGFLIFSANLHPGDM